jgi:anti-sigma factor RsiW
MHDPMPAKAPAAPCPEFEGLILDYFDPALSGVERRNVEAHVQICGACHTFWREQQQMDALLSSALHVRTLAPDFGDAILQQVKSELARGCEGKSVAPANELAALVSRLRSGLWKRAAWALLDGVGYAAIALTVGLSIQALFAQTPRWVASLPKEIDLYVAWSSAAICLLFGGWFGLKRHTRSLAFWH